MDRIKLIKYFQLLFAIILFFEIFYYGLSLDAYSYMKLIFLSFYLIVTIRLFFNPNKIWKVSLLMNVILFLFGVEYSIENYLHIYYKDAMYKYANYFLKYEFATGLFNIIPAFILVLLYMVYRKNFIRDSQKGY